jgi:hypothetical protein
MAAIGGLSGIFVRNSTVYSGGSMIVLHEVPNLVSIENSSGGVCYDGIIVPAKDVKLPDEKLAKLFAFKIDAGSLIAFTAAGEKPAAAPQFSAYLVRGK